MSEWKHTWTVFDPWLWPIVAWVLATAVIWTVTIYAALAAPPPGTDLNSPLHRWFEDQHSEVGESCCGEADGFILADEDWRATGAKFQVRIGGSWFDIPPGQMRDVTRGGPNPTGRAVVWYRIYGSGVPRIFCFAVGWMQ